MNRNRIWAAIKMMQRAKALDMHNWQTGMRENNFKVACTTKELHSCGNTACFAGYISLSPSFQKAGGEQTVLGCPVFMGKIGEEAVAMWLDISNAEAQALCFKSFHTYPVEWNEVKPEHVIAKLKDILAGKDITK